MRSKYYLAALSALLLFSIPAYAQISSNFGGANGGAVVVGESTTTCDAAAKGAIRYNSADTAMEYCNSTDWVQLNGTVDSSGTPPVWPAGTGYFVLTNTTYDGNLGGLSGADAKCLTDLTANTWLNKGSATVDSTHVKAFICNASVCNNLMPSTTYTFAHSGSATDGGATFTTDASGLGPGNSQNWSAVNYFAVGTGYWTNRGDSTSTLWASFRKSDTIGRTCDAFSTNSAGSGGYSGNSNNTGQGRWDFLEPTCDTLQPIICIVNP